MIRPLDIAAMLAGPIIVAALIAAFVSAPAPPPAPSPVAVPPSSPDDCHLAPAGAARPGAFAGVR
ncbi:MAG: hypothetical protein JNM13_15695 [Hyphomicrobiaceae bacterium]|nr:hypothetical protein [Hyphomicrobiaceae bacterium]